MQLSSHLSGVGRSQGAASGAGAAGGGGGGRNAQQRLFSRTPRPQATAGPGQDWEAASGPRGAVRGRASSSGMPLDS